MFHTSFLSYCVYNETISEGDKMLQICVLDDEYQDGKRNEDLLRAYFDKRHMEARIDRYTNGKELLDSTKIYHMLFLDIEIQEENGIEIAMELRKRLPDMIIVVITSYLKYSLEGYKIQASRYLLKPIHETLLYSELDEILQTRDTSQTLTLTMHQETTMVKMKEILYFASIGRTTCFHTPQGVYESKEGVSYWAKQLHVHFVECHKGLFVQLSHIMQIRKDCIEISNHETLPLARRRVQQVQESWLQFQEMSL